METSNHPNVTLNPYPNNEAICAASDDGRYLASAVGSSFVHVFLADGTGDLVKCHTVEDAARFIQKMIDLEDDGPTFEQQQAIAELRNRNARAKARNGGPR